MATLKDLTQNTNMVVTEVGLRKAFQDLKGYIDTQVTTNSGSLTTRVAALEALIDGTNDVDKVIDTFNEIKTFLADYDTDDTLKSLIDAVNTAIQAEVTRATNAETALAGRITTLENVNVMTDTQAHTLFGDVFTQA